MSGTAALPGQLAPFLYAGYVVLLSTAAASDACRFVIPNGVSLGLVGLFAGAALVQPDAPCWSCHLGVAAAVFLGGAGLSRLGTFGGGDVKLLSAVALWAGPDHLVPLLGSVALAGGVLALVLVALRRLVAVRAGRTAAAVPRVLVVGEGVPYGVAIALGAILVAPGLPYLATAL